LVAEREWRVCRKGTAVAVNVVAAVLCSVAPLKTLFVVADTAGVVHDVVVVVVVVVARWGVFDFATDVFATLVEYPVVVAEVALAARVVVAVVVNPSSSLLSELEV